MIKKLKQYSKKLSIRYNTNISYLLSGGFWLTIGQLGTSSASFILTVLLANTLNKADFGLYKYILSTIPILLILSLNGLSTALTQTVAKGFDANLPIVLRTKLQWSILSALGSLGMAMYYYTQGNNTLVVIYTLISPFLIIYNSYSLYTNYLNGKKAFKLSAKIKPIVELSGTFLFVLGLLIIQNIVIVIVSYFAIFSLVQFLAYQYTKVHFKSDISTTKFDPEGIVFGKHLSFMSVLTTIVKYIDKIIIFHFLGATELAIYSFAIAPVEYLSTFTSNIQTLLLSKFSKRNAHVIQEKMLKKIFMLGAFYLGLFIFYYPFSPYLYQILFPQYSEAIFPSQIYALSLFTLVGIVPQAYLESQRYIKRLYTLRIIIPIVTIGILLFSVQYGILGLIIGRVISKYIRVFYITTISHK